MEEKIILNKVKAKMGGVLSMLEGSDDLIHMLHYHASKLALNKVLKDTKALRPDCVEAIKVEVESTFGYDIGNVLRVGAGGKLPMVIMTLPDDNGELRAMSVYVFGLYVHEGKLEVAIKVEPDDPMVGHFEVSPEYFLDFDRLLATLFDEVDKAKESPCWCVKVC